LLADYEPGIEDFLEEPTRGTHSGS
jgi:hypothetical protein